MKCIKSVRSTKTIEMGTIKRVNDSEAHSLVSSKQWEYTPKSEYKKLNIVAETTVNDTNITIIAPKKKRAKKH